eukprot:IDg7988t1
MFLIVGGRDRDRVSIYFQSEFCLPAQWLRGPLVHMHESRSDREPSGANRILRENYELSSLQQSHLKITSSENHSSWNIVVCVRVWRVMLIGHREMLSLDKAGKHANSPTVQCGLCGRYFLSTIALGRHIRSVHSSARVVNSLSSSLEVHGFGNHGNANDAMDNFLDELDNEPVLENVADMLRFCCTRRLTKGEAEAQYNFVLSCSRESCSCTEDFRDQFPKAAAFVDYLQRARRKFVVGQGWRTARIPTEYGLNTTGVFRSIVSIVEQELVKAGGLCPIMKFEEKFEGRERVYSSPVDSNSIRSYEESIFTD